jgi:hypothetical protein
MYLLKLLVERVDEILDKITLGGIDSITVEEKYYLDNN